MTAPRRFYDDLARWWPLVSPVEDYADEAAEYLRVLADAASGAQTLLELGCGGGHNAFHMKARYRLTLTDLSEPMLALSRRLNPECEHVAGDMRNLALGRTFDIVFVHDAIDYMATGRDLADAIATAARHCAPGGAVLLVPDHVKETFVPSTDCGGHDGPDGEGVRYLEWSWDPDPGDDHGAVVYSFILRERERDGAWWSHTEEHRFGLFSRDTWLRLMADAGLDASVLEERTGEDRVPRAMFLGKKPGPHQAHPRSGAIVATSLDGQFRPGGA
jgi:SAM-dependent methyltransferase